MEKTGNKLGVIVKNRKVKIQYIGSEIKKKE